MFVTMFISATLALSMLASPHLLSVTQTSKTPSEITRFNGVSISFDVSDVIRAQENITVVLEDFPLGNERQVNLLLQKFEVFTTSAKVVSASINNEGKVIHRALPRPNIILLKGAIEGDPSSRVFIAIGEHTTNGIIESEGSTYIIAKDKTRGWTTVYNLTNVDPEDMNWVDFQCGVEEMARPVLKKSERASSRAIGGCQALQIAVDTDWEFTGDLFEGNTAASSEYATTLMGAMSAIYNVDVNTGIQISYLRLWDNASDPWTSNNTGAQLPQFRDHWQTEMQGVSRHLTHLLSARSLGGGIAYVGAACTSLGYAVSGNLHGSFPLPLTDFHQNNWDIMVIAHETGHNCGTWHTHDYSPVIDGCGNGDCSAALGGTIMSYCHTCSGGMTNLVLTFHPRVQTTIENYLANDVSCSLDCDQSLTGACCHDSSCTELTAADCTDSGGLHLGSATTCASASCDPQIGACCSGDNNCSVINSNSCANIDGIFIGLGTSCDSGWCDPNALHACCVDATCSDLKQTDCQLAGGFWEGVGTSCDSGGCLPLVNDFCDTAMQVTTGVWSFSTLGALTDDVPFDNEQCETEYLGNMHHDVWFLYEACQSSELLISTCGIVNFDSDIVVYQGTCGELVQVECNGDGDGCGGYTSEVTLNVFEGENYLIRVGGWSSLTVGTGQLLIGGQICVNDVPCVGDVNGDSEVDITDLLAVIDHWGEMSVQYDIDENGVVDTGDILFVIANWGNCDY